jgi:hypothetical protein
VLGLPEVGDPDALNRGKTALGTRYPRVLVATHFDAMHPIRTAVLLRRGVHASDATEIAGFPPGALVDVPQGSGPLNAMGRGALDYAATIAGETVRVIVMHLKSKLLTYPGGDSPPRDENERARAGGYALFRRAAVAVAVRVRVDEWLTAKPGGTVIAMGDLRDGPDAATTQILYDPGDETSPGKTKATRGGSSTSHASSHRVSSSAASTKSAVSSSTTSSPAPTSPAATPPSRSTPHMSPPSVSSPHNARKQPGPTTPPSSRRSPEHAARRQLPIYRSAVRYQHEQLRLARDAYRSPALERNGRVVSVLGRRRSVRVLDPVIRGTSMAVRLVFWDMTMVNVTVSTSTRSAPDLLRHRGQLTVAVFVTWRDWTRRWVRRSP